MAGKSFTLKGLDQIEAKLRKLPDQLGKRVIRQALKEALAPMASQAAHNAPHDTGALADSIEVKSGKGKRGVVAVNVVTTNQHAAYQEYGTSKTAPTGFMRRALDEIQDQVMAEALRLILEGLQEEIDR